jgi:hypothetical protein
MLRGKKAQVGIAGFLILIGFFIIFWFVWLGGFLADIGGQMIETNHMTGIEAFFYGNINLVIFISLILGLIGYGLFRGGFG